ncbi:MAG: ATP-binding protein [Thermoanaerobaculum sp.]
MGRFLVSSSGGKDSLLALARTLEAGREVVGLLTTVSEPFGRVTMHGVRRELMAAQAEALGLPLFEVRLPQPQPENPEDRCPLCPLDAPQAGLVPNTTYEKVMLAALEPLVQSGVEGVVFGDIHLADLRRFREALLARVGLSAEFPLWGNDPETLAAEFAAQGGRAIVVCCREDLGFLLGSRTDNGFLGKLPAGVDPCGENGEFHTFVFAHKLFSKQVPFVLGERINRDGFVWQDLVLA